MKKPNSTIFSKWQNGGVIKAELYPESSSPNTVRNFV